MREGNYAFPLNFFWHFSFDLRILKLDSIEFVKVV